MKTFNAMVPTYLDIDGTADTNKVMPDADFNYKTNGSVVIPDTANCPATTCSIILWHPSLN